MADLTYAEVGATRTPGGHPAGAFTHDRRLRVGDASVFDAAAAFVLGFGMQRGAGYDVSSTTPAAQPGTDLLLRTRIGPLRFRAPARVVYVVDERDARGFAYGTLTGHPERGEQLFQVTRDATGTWAEVRAFSWPGRWFTRLGAPVVRRLQVRATDRYLDAVRRAV